ncbi:hypothetical protein PENTCL1PPCAC_22059, partial [Pristionchus entomophagus]
FSFQCLTSANVSFNALPSRVWQFIGGGIAHELMSWQTGPPSIMQADGKSYSPVPTSDGVPLLENEEKEEKEEIELEEVEFREKSRSSCKSVLLSFLATILTLLLFALSLSPISFLLNEALRASTISLTAAVIVLGRVEERQSVMLSNRPIVYLGDISYVVYLVHWPVSIMWKSYWDLQELPLKDILICLSLTFLISTLVHHTLEHMFISASTTVSFIVVGVIYLLMFCAVVFSLPQHLNNAVKTKVPMDQIIAEAIKWNERESHTQYYNQRPFKECVDDPEGKKMRDGYSTQSAYECIWKPNHTDASVSILLVGNSISHRSIKILRPILENNQDLKEIRLFAHSACKPIEGDCAEFFTAMMRLVERMQPDITFLIYDESKRLREPIVDISSDMSLADFVDFLKPLSTNSKYLVLDEFYPSALTTAGVAASMYKRLLRNQSLDDLKGQYQPFLDSYSFYFRRLDQLPSHYPNLVRHNTSGPLCAEQPGWCWWYNRKNLHAYFTDNLHLTADGLEMEKESYKKVVENLIQKVKKDKNRTSK